MARDNYTSPYGRYKIEEFYESDSQHFHPDTDYELKVIDTQTEKVLMTFDCDWSRDKSIQTVGFSKDGLQVIARNGQGKIVKKVDLI